VVPIGWVFDVIVKQGAGRVARLDDGESMEKQNLVTHTHEVFNGIQEIDDISTLLL
jgi:hypothetical protein